MPAVGLFVVNAQELGEVGRADGKLGGYLRQRLRQPTVAGKVLVGLILGPSLRNLLQWPMFNAPHLGETISHLAELGVLLLMLIAGLDEVVHCP